MEGEVEVYNALHRDAEHCGAGSELLYELQILAGHFHPSVRVFVASVLKGERIDYPGDPQEDFQPMRFLDRFVCHNSNPTP